MKGFKHIYWVTILALSLIVSTTAKTEQTWSDQFKSTNTKAASNDSALTFDDVLQKVAAGNQMIRSFEFHKNAAQHNIRQAELRSNPEISADIEEFGWNAPGFKESEFSISLSQEFEFFGQRNARQNFAHAELDGTNLQIKLALFDLYLKTKYQFYSLVHAKQSVILSQTSYELTKEIVENITSRLNRGAALNSELLLAQLESQRSKLALDQSKQDVMAIEATLVSLWNGTATNLDIAFTPEPDFHKVLHKLLLFDVANIVDSTQIDSTRNLVEMFNQTNLLQAERTLAEAEAKPPITFSSGFKRAEIDNSKSFHFGVSMPIPFFNRNQGTQANINAKIRALDYEINQTKNETKAIIHSQSIRLNQMIEKHTVLDSELLPTAIKVYQNLQSAYEAGRVPYTQLLEAKRTLNEISFEHNDLLLTIQEQIIALEHLTGVTLRLDKEN